MKKKLLDLVFKTYNLFVPKIKNSIFVYSDPSEVKNCVDILNYTTSNVLCLIQELLNRKFENRLIIYILCLMPWRLSEYEEIIEKALKNNIELHFISVHNIKFNLFKKIKTYFYAYKTKLWLITTGDCYIYGKLKKQTIISPH